jgi:NAD+ kinase
MGMSTQAPNVATFPRPSAAPRRVGLVVHPTRSIAEPLRLLREWCEAHGVEIVQIRAAYEQRQVAEPGDPAGADLIVSIGGDGTTLAAMRTGAAVNRPALGIACGSLGALATVAVADVTRAMDRFSRGEWLGRTFPALSVTRVGGDPLLAFNDLAVVRDGGGQVRVTARVDGVLFARLAGDGVVVSTPIGSSGYAISAGGPLLAGGVDAFVLTPLPKHGGFVPPLIIGPGAELILDVMTGYAGVRLEVDGQEVGQHVRSLTLSLRPDVATMVSFADEEPALTGLRRRRIILDSPRVVADDQAG